MKQLITDILKRLGEAPMPENYPRLRKNDRLFEYVDVDWGQCDFYERHTVKYPCALVDINSAVYESEGNFVQTGNIGVQVRIIDLVLNNSSYQAPENQKDVAFAVFNLIAETNRLLHGWGQYVMESDEYTDGYGRLVKQSITKVNRRDGLREYKLLFRVQLTDIAAVPKREKKPTIYQKKICSPSCGNF